MKFDFSEYSYFDNHTHLLYTDKLSVTKDAFAINYYHGIRDDVDAAGKPAPSYTAVSHLPYQSVIRMLAHAMSQKFGCEPTIEACTAFRNSMTKTPGELKAYTKLLYEDENIIGCMLDAEHPMSEPVGDCFPCRVFRLFRYEDVFTALLKSEENYTDFLDKFLAAVRQAAADGFDGMKGHIGEKFGFAVRNVSAEEAAAAFPKAKAGDAEAKTTVYYAMFAELLVLCGELDIPVHLHTGTTGFKTRTGVYQVDPILMAPFLKDPRFFQTKLVLLHGSFPYTRNAAWMAYNFPNVYLDLSQTQLWQGVMAPQLFADALTCAPHDKILMGSGQHWYCEMAWMASKIAKRTLERVLGDMVESNLYSAAQAEESARLILGENAMRMYDKQ